MKQRRWFRMMVWSTVVLIVVLHLAFAMPVYQLGWAGIVPLKSSAPMIPGVLLLELINRQVVLSVVVPLVAGALLVGVFYYGRWAAMAAR